MEIDFIKMHGAGNDFVMIDDLSCELELLPEQVARLCDRHFGVGADGVILVRPSRHADCVAYMHYINADGSLAQMCGNGVRCFAKYLVDGGFAAPAATDAPGVGSLCAETLAGKRHIVYKTDLQGRLAEATVDMGTPVLLPAEVPTTLPATAATFAGPAVLDRVVPTPFGDFAISCVSMGNPHAVIFSEAFAADPAGFALDAAGSWLEGNTELFPEKTNVEFAAVTSPGNITMRVYERGVGETLACGTGACAVAVAAALSGRCGRAADVALPGGTLHIEWDAESGRVSMTGPATTVYEGKIAI